MHGKARLLALFVVLGCKAAPSAMAPAEATTDAPGTADPSPAAVRSPTAVQWGERVPSQQVLDDLQVIVSGNFSIDHIGPDVLREIEARYAADPAIYLEAVFRELVEGEQDPRRHAGLHIPDFLENLYELEPARVESLAGRMRRNYDVFLAPETLDAGTTKRIEERRDALVVLEGGIDRPIDASWPVAEIDSVCAVAARGDQGLRVIDGCACGEPLACRAGLDGSTIAIDARVVAGVVGACSECWPTWTTCRVPKLDPGARVDILVDGKRIGAMTADASGWLGATACVP